MTAQKTAELKSVAIDPRTYALSQLDSEHLVRVKNETRELETNYTVGARRGVASVC
jgi:hypothetical protein